MNDKNNMDNEEIKTISFSFSYNDPDNNETTFQKVIDLPEYDNDGIFTLLDNFTKFLQLSGYDYVKGLKVGIEDRD